MALINALLAHLESEGRMRAGGGVGRRGGRGLLDQGSKCVKAVPLLSPGTVIMSAVPDPRVRLGLQTLIIPSKHLFPIIGK